MSFATTILVSNCVGCSNFFHCSVRKAGCAAAHDTVKELAIAQPAATATIQADCLNELLAANYASLPKFCCEAK